MHELSWAGGVLHVVSELARGGMGSVMLALRDEGGVRRAFAVKRLHPSLRSDEEALGRFVEEASLAAELRHPNVVSVLDVGSDERGPFIVMELVAGMSLREIRETLADRGLALPPQIALRILHQVAEALRAAHAHDIAHRDVSPSNVLVGFDGSARLIDFGLAKVIHDHQSRALLRGTVGYMSPEQLRFERLDVRTDLFSFGVLLHESLARARLYGDPDVRVAARRILGEPAPDLRERVPEVSDELAHLTQRLLAKDPSARPSDVEQVCGLLRRSVYEHVVSEGVLDLSSWMEGVFADEIHRRRERLAEHWSQVSEWKRRHDTSAPARQRSLRRAPVWAAAASLAVVGALATALAFSDRAPSPIPSHEKPVASTAKTSSEEASEPSAQPPLAAEMVAAPARDAVEPAEAPVRDRAESPDATFRVEAAETSPARGAEATPTKRAEPAARPARQRRLGRRRRAPAPRSEEPQRPLWEW